MALKAFAVAVTLITGIGFAGTADARCGGRSFDDGARTGSSGRTAAEARNATVREPSVTPGDDALPDYRRNGDLDRIPVATDGMPRRRC